MEDVFPLRDNIDYTKLKLTKEGEYSVTRRRDAERIINIMITTIGDPKTKTITDVTGCVGGDTIHFGLYFQTVHSIEINKENYEALQNNVSIYNLQNVKLYNDDATKLFNWKTDVLYIDPPWGGKQYKESKELDLYMSSKRLDEWIDEILKRKNRPSYLFVKLPHNYNFKRFNFLSNVDYIKPYRIRGYILICITIHKPRNP